MKGGTKRKRKGKGKEKNKTKKLGRGQSKAAKRSRSEHLMQFHARQSLQRASDREAIQRAARSLIQAVSRARKIPVVKMKIEKNPKKPTEPTFIPKLTARQQDKKTKENLDKALEALQGFKI